MKMLMKCIKLEDVIKALHENPDNCFASRQSNPKSHIYMQKGSTVAGSEMRANPVQLLRMKHPLYYVEIESHIDMIIFIDPPEKVEKYKENPQGKVIVGWNPTEEDMAATDWILYTITDEED